VARYTRETISHSAYFSGPQFRVPARSDFDISRFLLIDRPKRKQLLNHKPRW
jgi:hypothetical protein